LSGRDSLSGLQPTGTDSQLLARTRLGRPP
jgi:hypothetical protein